MGLKNWVLKLSESKELAFAHIVNAIKELGAKSGRVLGKWGFYHKLYDSSYDPTAYERPVLAVDTVILRIDGGILQCLLIERGTDTELTNDPNSGKLALPGGCVEIAKKEPILTAAYRELEEETGLTTVPLHKLNAFGGPDWDERWYFTTHAYVGIIPFGENDQHVAKTTSEALSINWVNLYEFAEKGYPMLMRSHGEILEAVFEYCSLAKTTSRFIDLSNPLSASVSRALRGI